MAKNKKSKTPAQSQPAPQSAPARPAEAKSAPPAATGASPVKWMIILLALVTFLINAPTIGFDYTLDDPFFTKDNPNVSQGLSAIKEFFTHAAYYGVFQHHDASYRPLMLTSFALEKDLFGFNPHTGHLINLLLFTLEVVFIFILLRRMFRNMSPYIPFLMTLLFALHPIHTEVVASIKSRDEILGLLFSVLTLSQTLKFADEQKTKNLLLSGLFFFCALMSKETPIALVAIAPITLWFFRPHQKVSDIMRATVPYIAVAAVYMLMRSMFIENDGEKVVIMVNNNALMAAANYGEKLATLLWIQLKYIILLFVPHPLSYDYSYSQIPIISFANIKALAALAVIGAMLVYAITRFARRDVFAWCILFYASSVVITSNLLVTIGATMAERFIFSGSLAFCIAIVLLLAKLLKIDTATFDMGSGKTLFGIVGVVALLYGVKTFARNEAWRDNVTLYKTGLETAPNSWRAQYLLAVEYTKMIPKESDPLVKKQLYEDAVTGFRKSLQILPFNSDVYLLRGYADEFYGQNDSAIANYSMTLKYDSANKQAAINLGGAQMRTGRLDDAIVTLSRVVRTDSLNPDALTNLGASYGNKGMFKEAEKYYLKAVSIKADQPPNVFLSMSNIYRFMGDSANAQKYRALMMQAVNRAQSPQ